MRRIFTSWLIVLFSLTSLAAVGQPARICHSEGALFATEESRLQCPRFFAALRMTFHNQITFEEYWELVRNTRQALGQMEALPEAEMRQQLNESAAEWEKVTAVEFPDKSVVLIDPSYLIDEIKKDPPDLKRLEGLMDALLKAHEEYPQEVFAIQDVEPLQEILARPEFQWGEPQVIQMPEWIQKIFNALADLMDRLLFGVQNGVYYGRVPIIIVLVMLFIFSLFFISRNLSRSLVREAELAAQNGDDDAILTSKGAMQRAQTLSGQGDYRNAVRYLYLSSLLILDEQGLMRYDRSRTNREYLRSVSSRPQLAKPLGDVIDVFDKVWYGFEPVDDESYRSYVKHVDELRENKE